MKYVADINDSPLLRHSSLITGLFRPSRRQNSTEFVRVWSRRRPDHADGDEDDEALFTGEVRMTRDERFSAVNGHALALDQVEKSDGEFVYVCRIMLADADVNLAHTLTVHDAFAIATVSV